MKYYLGIDNGVSGTIAILTQEGGVRLFRKTPTKSEQSYTKTKKNITRIDVKNFLFLLKPYQDEQITVVLERPMVNPKRFTATLSAMRALEATLCVLESLGIGLQYCDSKQWQKEMLPKGVSGSPELKKASLDISTRLFPEYTDTIKKHGDGDALLIAEWARRHNL